MYHDQPFPPRIEGAFRALAYTHSVEAGGVTVTPRGPQATPARVLTGAETALRNTAAEVLRNFISGEIRVPRPRRPRRTHAPTHPMPGTTPFGEDLDCGDMPTHDPQDN